MAHFFVPPGADPIRYPITNDGGFRHPWKLIVDLGQTLPLGLWGGYDNDGSPLKLTSNNPGIIEGTEPSTSGGDRLISVRGNRIGFTILDAVGAFGPWCSIQIEVRHPTGPVAPADQIIDIDYIDADPKSHPDYIDRQCEAVGYGIYNGGYYIYVPGRYAAVPVLVPEHMRWFGAASTVRVSDTVYDSFEEARNAVGDIRDPSRVAYFWGVGGRLVCPTAFTNVTAPTIVNTAGYVIDTLVDEVQRDLIAIAIPLIGGIVGRSILARMMKARPAGSTPPLRRDKTSRNDPAKPTPPAPKPPLPKQRIVVDANVIRQAMKNAPLKTQQRGGISIPRIQEYVDRLAAGETPPPIKVDDGIIVDGNHRYVAGRVFGKDPPIQPWAGGRPERVVPWEQLNISTEKW